MAKVAIIGAGVVGGATGRGLEARGHEVKFFDVNPSVVNSLRYLKYPADFPENMDDDSYDVYMISVSTPTVEGKLDFSFLENAIKELGKALKRRKEKKYFTLIVRSTVYPGTTRQRLVPLLEKYSGLKVNEDFGVSMNPEFLREKTADEDFKNPWAIVVGADDEKTAQIVKQLYTPAKCPITFLSIKEAELEKYVHNLFNAAKISFFNEMRLVAQKAGINADKVFRAVAESAEGSWNKEYGIRNRGPFGGSCLPKDTQAFLTYVKDRYKFKLPILSSTIEINEKIKRLGDSKIKT